MSGKITLMIPTQLSHSYLYPANHEVRVNVEQYQEWDVSLLNQGLYEWLYYHDLSCFKPWEQPEAVLKDLMVLWKDKQIILTDLFAKRAAKEAAPYMRDSILIALLALFYANEKPLKLNHLEDQILALEHVPVNFMERFSFILSRPNLYQSFKALEQIMIEIEKMFARIMIRKQNELRKRASQA